MPVSQESLQQALENAFPNSDIELKDLVGDEDHWSATVSSPQFAGKNRIEQHKLVQAAVAELNIHALQIKTQVKD